MTCVSQKRSLLKLPYNLVVMSYFLQSKQESKPQVITHGDELTLGSTSLRLHIHPGSQTCDSCEPGQVQAQAQQGTLFVQDDEGKKVRYLPPHKQTTMGIEAGGNIIFFWLPRHL